MLRKLNDITGFTIAATDEEIGSVDDFYFDDNTWSIRYVIVDTGPWLFGKQVLVSPTAIQAPEWEAKILPVNLTKEQVENSPLIGVDEPVSRQYEVDLHRYYGWPGYWYAAPGMAAPMGGLHAVPAPAPIPASATLTTERTAVAEAEEDVVEESGNPHLRSMKEVLGYNIQATDEPIGHVEDFFADDEEWQIRYMLVDTRNWLPGRKVLVGIDWIDHIDWAKQDVVVNVTREQVENSPEYDPQEPVRRSYETDLYNHYQLPGYWV